jgi:hypothetical protein
MDFIAIPLWEVAFQCQCRIADPDRPPHVEAYLLRQARPPNRVGVRPRQTSQWHGASNTAYRCGMQIGVIVLGQVAGLSVVP